MPGVTRSRWLYIYSKKKKKKKHLKIFSGTNRPMYVAMSSNKFCTNEDPMFTMTYFMAMSNSIPNAFILKNVERLIFQEGIRMLARYM